MKIHYDQETDSLYISLSNSVNVESTEVSPGVVLDFDNKNNVVGIEIDHASTIVDLDQIDLGTLRKDN